MIVLKWLDEHFEEFVIVVCLIILSILTSLNVVLRYVFNSSLIWSEEACKLSLIISGFLSIGYCVKHGLMIKVDALVQVLNRRSQQLLQAITTVILLAFFCVASIAAFNVVKGTCLSGQVSAALRIPVFIIYLIPAFGFVLAVVRLIQRMILALLNLDTNHNNAGE